MKVDDAIRVLLGPFLVADMVVTAIVDYAEAFVGYQLGIIEGVYDGVADLVHAGIDNVTEVFRLAKSIFTGGLLGELKRLAGKLMDIVKSLPDLPAVLGNWFANEWNSSGAFGKARLIGKIVGYIAINILVGVLTAGESLAAEGGELRQAAIKMLKIADKPANPCTFVKPVVRGAEVVPGVGRVVTAAGKVTKVAGHVVTLPVRAAAAGVIEVARLPATLRRWFAGGGELAERAAPEIERAAPAAERAATRGQTRADAAAASRALAKRAASEYERALDELGAALRSGLHGGASGLHLDKVAKVAYYWAKKGITSFDAFVKELLESHLADANDLDRLLRENRQALEAAFLEGEGVPFRPPKERRRQKLRYAPT